MENSFSVQHTKINWTGSAVFEVLTAVFFWKNSSSGIAEFLQDLIYAKNKHKATIKVAVTVNCWSNLFFDSEEGGKISFKISLDFQQTIQCLYIPELEFSWTSLFTGTHIRYAAIQKCSFLLCKSICFCRVRYLCGTVYSITDFGHYKEEIDTLGITK
jgi:hypothetical protein